MTFVADPTESAIRELLFDVLGLSPATVAAMTTIRSYSARCPNSIQWRSQAC